MIKVTDKFVGLVNKPGYTHCSTQHDFGYEIIRSSIEESAYAETIMNHLRENDVISAEEVPEIYYGQVGLTTKTWNEAEQTLTREIIYGSIEDYNTVKELHTKIDWISIFPEEMFEYTVVSVDEV